MVHVCAHTLISSVGVERRGSVLAARGPVTSRGGGSAQGGPEGQSLTGEAKGGATMV